MPKTTGLPQLGSALFLIFASLYITACGPKMQSHQETDPASDSVYTKVEKESSYPGGRDAWMRYLIKTFRYPITAQQNKIQGIVVIQFIVGKDGKLSNIEAVSGPKEGGLREEAIRVVEDSGTWLPATQNGRLVKSYKKQPIIFRLE